MFSSSETQLFFSTENVPAARNDDSEADFFDWSRAEAGTDSLQQDQHRDRLSDACLKKNLKILIALKFCNTLTYVEASGSLIFDKKIFLPQKIILYSLHPCI